MTETPAFHSADSALRWAYGICRLGVYERPLTARKEEHERDPLRRPRYPGLNPLEKHAEAALIIRAVERSVLLTPTERTLIEARYMVPNDEGLEARKADAVERLAEALTGRFHRRPDFVRDVARRFCRLPCETDRAWARLRGCRVDTVRDQRRLITDALHDMLDVALAKLEAKWQEGGRLAA